MEQKLKCVEGKSCDISYFRNEFVIKGRYVGALGLLLGSSRLDMIDEESLANIYYLISDLGKEIEELADELETLEGNNGG